MNAPAFSICVYCGSRPGVDTRFAHTAAEVGHWIGARGGQLVYGGGRSGLMGVVADATLAAGGRVVGVIPRTLVEREHAHRGCTELHVVETMHERKRIMAEHADAFLALPGGFKKVQDAGQITAVFLFQPVKQIQAIIDPLQFQRILFILINQVLQLLAGLLQSF